ncbi:MAG: imidazoleglycerol-phosphate dehydratase [Candidatus Omnitrophota bacterium]
MRKASEKRETKETKITVNLNVDGTGKTEINTPLKLLNHMLELFAFHGLFDLDIKAKGDVEKIDIHHTNEDIGIVLGDAFNKALGDKKGIKRIGFSSVPMEEVTAAVTIDISGRGSFKLNIREVYSQPMDEGSYGLKDAEHFFESFAKHSGINLSIKIENVSPALHTTLEPVFKAFGIALDQATQIDPRRKSVPSTKGVID